MKVRYESFLHPCVSKYSCLLINNKYFFPHLPLLQKIRETLDMSEIKNHIFAAYLDWTDAAYV